MGQHSARPDWLCSPARYGPTFLTIRGRGTNDGIAQGNWTPKGSHSFPLETKLVSRRTARLSGVVPHIRVPVSHAISFCWATVPRNCELPIPGSTRHVVKDRCLAPYYRNGATYHAQYVPTPLTRTIAQNTSSVRIQNFQCLNRSHWGRTFVPATITI
jgi:hypothetical protein